MIGVCVWQMFNLSVQAQSTTVTGHMPTGELLWGQT